MKEVFILIVAIGVVIILTSVAFYSFGHKSVQVFLIGYMCGMVALAIAAVVKENYV